MRLVFVGGGSLTRELYSWMKKADQISSYDDICYISPTKSDLALTYLGDISDEQVQSTDHLLLAIGSTQFREQAIEKLLKVKNQFIQYIHPTALINENVKLGVGSIVLPFCIVSNDTIVGDFAFLNGYSSIGHDCIIGNNIILSPYSVITGGCIVGDNVALGTHSVVIPKRKIENNVKVSPGAVVMKNVANGLTVIGSMGQTIKL